MVKLKSLWASYTNALNLPLLSRMMKRGYARKGPDGGAYGARTAMGKWMRGYNPKGSRPVDFYARSATLAAGGALTAGASATLAGSLAGKKSRSRGEVAPIIINLPNNPYNHMWPN
jgi:hypothetical protein